jgi:membrane protease YdiL (CAAX protease family)
MSQVFALAALAAFGLQLAIGMAAPASVVGVVLAIGVALAALRWGNPPAQSIATFIALVALALTAVIVGLNGVAWTLAALAGGAAFLALTRIRPRLALGSTWRQVGRVPVLGTLSCAAVTPLALGAWLRFAKPDLHDLVAAVPSLPWPVLVMGATAFVAINATVEELIWRGVLLDRLTPLFGGSAAVALQAVSFGAAHAHGFPRGAVGVILVAVWGAMLGALRRASAGLLAPWLAHVTADTVIAVLVLGMAR